jgi:hypothetical protein
MSGRWVATAARIATGVTLSDAVRATILAGEAIFPSRSSGVSMSQSSAYQIMNTDLMGALSALSAETNELGPVNVWRFGKQIGPKGGIGPCRGRLNSVIVGCRFKKAVRRAQDWGWTV